jgi:hypothetical protein
MTLPEEEARAVDAVRQFLFELLDPKLTPRVPKGIRQRSRRLLKHYPLLPSLGWADRLHRKRKGMP